MRKLDDARFRSKMLGQLIQQRADTMLKSLIQNYEGELRFDPLENLMIGSAAWNHIETLDIRPELVFAHPDVLVAHPSTSQYYRGLALLSQKQVGQLATPVASWEDGSRKQPIKPETGLKVARLYNSVTSSMIEGSVDWTLENGYRNIIATMGISLDGMFRNRIGQMAEQLVKSRVVDVARQRGLVLTEESPTRFGLLQDTWMYFGSEPDIAFERDGKIIATVEIKGGKDPAAALERLGAMQKSFAQTPPGCDNFLVAGAITEEMRHRLDEMGVVQTFLLDEIAEDGSEWERFLKELFHHALRLI